MDKETFIEHFAVTFMATWVANEYAAACFNGEHERLENPQIEDAYFIAEKVWENKQKVMG